MQLIQNTRNKIRRLLDKSQNQRHKTIYKSVCKCLVETNNIAKEILKDKLKRKGKQEGYFAQLRYLLFTHPNTIFLIPFLLFLILLVPAYIIRTFVENLLVRLCFVFFCILLYLLLPLLLLKITPKLNLGLHKRWSKVIGCCMRSENWNNNTAQFKRDINRAILSYLWEGKPLGFIVNILWGGIFIGCLPDPDFQEALITMSLNEIFKANLFGALCLILLPFVYIYYFINYDTPIAQMELVIAQLEIEQ